VVAGDDPWPFIPAFPGASGNLPELEAAAKGIGAINWVPDRDQIVRRVPLLYRIGNEPVPHYRPSFSGLVRVQAPTFSRQPMQAERRALAATPGLIT